MVALQTPRNKHIHHNSTAAKYAVNAHWSNTTQEQYYKSEVILGFWTDSQAFSFPFL